MDCIAEVVMEIGLAARDRGWLLLAAEVGVRD